MKKKDVLLIAAVLVLALIVAMISKGLGPKAKDLPPGDWVVVTVDGGEYARVQPGDQQTIPIVLADGSVNVLVVTENGAYMESANCRDQICVQQGALTVDNYETRVNGSWIICLPHKVSVELVVGDD